MAEILLLGTIHADPRLSELVTRALEAEQPSLVTIEEAANQDEIEAKLKEKYAERLQWMSDNGISTKCLFRGPREEKSVAKYCAARKIRYLGIDKEIKEESLGIVTFGLISYISVFGKPPVFIRRTIKEEEAADINENMLALIKSRKKATEHLDQCRKHFGTRDSTPATLLEQLGKSYEKIVHVCGASHILDDENRETLYARIKHLHPRRATVRQY